MDTDTQRLPMALYSYWTVAVGLAIGIGYERGVVSLGLTVVLLAAVPFITYSCWFFVFEPWGKKHLGGGSDGG